VADRARSDDAAVQAQLDRLALLSPGRDMLGLERIAELLARLGNPERALPPVLHVAGTNGKGSTCAFLRAAIEAAGLAAHVYTSPHLVRFNERIRLAGRLIDDAALAALLCETLDSAGAMALSFFEATTAAAFLAFARTPADACIVEVGLGGRLDATNVIEAPLVCGITQLGHDHHAFLGDRLEQIAAEKAGIAKPGVPLVTETYPEAIAEVVGRTAAAAGALWLPRGRSWDAELGAAFGYRDQWGAIDAPPPELGGAHQTRNAALAIAMLRHQRLLDVPEAALKAGIGRARWPARLQRLAPGPLRELLPAGAELWLDGAHNPAAARAIADHFRGLDRPFHLIVGLLANKDAAGVLEPFRALASTIQAVPVPDHDHHPPEALAAQAAPDVAAALRRIGPDGPPVVLIVGSLYLAGEVLKANGQAPD
jgi:dihydrofolate synthase / folylpolyglutamate synthase